MSDFAGHADAARLSNGHRQAAAEDVVAVKSAGLAWPKSWPVRLWYGLCSTLEWLLGWPACWLALALLAAMPIVNPHHARLSARSERPCGPQRQNSRRLYRHCQIRPHWQHGGRHMALFAGAPAYFVAGQRCLAIDPDGFASRGWRRLSSPLRACHRPCVLAWYSGGRLRHFFGRSWRRFNWPGDWFSGSHRPILRPLIRARGRRWP